jgi:protein-tyrosine-phosphatase
MITDVIVYICAGNTCRSATASVLAQNFLYNWDWIAGSKQGEWEKGNHKIIIKSAGVAANVGNSLTPMAGKVLLDTERAISNRPELKHIRNFKYLIEEQNKHFITIHESKKFIDSRKYIFNDENAKYYLYCADTSVVNRVKRDLDITKTNRGKKNVTLICQGRDIFDPAETGDFEDYKKMVNDVYGCVKKNLLQLISVSKITPSSYWSSEGSWDELAGIPKRQRKTKRKSKQIDKNKTHIRRKNRWKWMKKTKKNKKNKKKRK